MGKDSSALWRNVQKFVTKNQRFRNLKMNADAVSQRMSSLPIIASTNVAKRKTFSGHSLLNPLRPWRSQHSIMCRWIDDQCVTHPLAPFRQHSPRLSRAFGLYDTALVWLSSNVMLISMDISSENRSGG